MINNDNIAMDGSKKKEEFNKKTFVINIFKEIQKFKPLIPISEVLRIMNDERQSRLTYEQLYDVAKFNRLLDTNTKSQVNDVLQNLESTYSEAIVLNVFDNFPTISVFEPASQIHKKINSIYVTYELQFIILAPPIPNFWDLICTS